MSNATKTKSAAKIKLDSFDDLFGNSTTQENLAEQIINVPLTELHTFKDHPFRVADDEKMEETTESIRQYGVLVPGIARPRAGGGYEIIAGHRRKRGSELAGRAEMPVIVRSYTDDEATIIMVDSNIQREDILPSEKAKAYRMKYEAMKHQGKKSGKNTLEEVGEAAGENAKKVQRYIWLSRLSEELLAMVDHKKIGFSPGVDLSFLPEEAQQWVQVILEEQGCTISTTQSAKIKEYGKSGELTPAMVRLILTEEKTKERRVTLKTDKISRYFEEKYSSEEIEDIIIQLLEEWSAKNNTKKQ
ncbi:MAG: ParB/RepB/Spo0J family partition protein [Lachnospiraceae bacterium]|nr:ParB/RepB/Spo0J family partition protein [Lachnospiraceae bacterium]